MAGCAPRPLVPSSEDGDPSSDAHGLSTRHLLGAGSRRNQVGGLRGRSVGQGALGLEAAVPAHVWASARLPRLPPVPLPRHQRLRPLTCSALCTSNPARKCDFPECGAGEETQSPAQAPGQCVPTRRAGGRSPRTCPLWRAHLPRLLHPHGKWDGNGGRALRAPHLCRSSCTSCSARAGPGRRPPAARRSGRTAPAPAGTTTPRRTGRPLELMADKTTW